VRRFARRPDAIGACEHQRVVQRRHTGRPGVSRRCTTR
jgi:hypothetical protein